MNPAGIFLRVGQTFKKTLKAAIRSSVPKLACSLPKSHTKTLQTSPIAQLTLIEVANTLTGVFWQYSWQCHAVKAFLPFLL